MTDLKDLYTIAIERGSKIVSAESCTAGLLAACLTDMPGSSAFFEQGYITYSNRSKISVLGVDKKTLERHGAVSEEVAKQMAKGALNKIKGHDSYFNHRHCWSRWERLQTRRFSLLCNCQKKW